ncbi:MAG: hypothetical protein WDN25_04260 [Acetobacteraceae bacterium]
MSGNRIDIAAVYHLLLQVAEAVGVQSVTLDGHGRLLNDHTGVLNEQTRILNEHSRTLNEQTRVLNEHSRTLNEHTRLLNDLTLVVNDHSRTLADQSRVLNDHTLTLHDQGRRLGDIESGQVSLRQTVAHYHASVMGHGILISELDHRVQRIENHLGLSSAT